MENENKRRDGIIWIGIIIISCILLLNVIIPKASALEIRQGDIAYLGETVDISQAIAWPDFTIAWCNGGDYGCEPPDQTIQITNHMYTYYLDPAIFREGTYYRWDGHWNRGENMVAFTINPGTRPKVVNETTQPTPIESVAIKPVEGPYHFSIARGDTALFKTYQNRTDAGHIWIFAPTIDSYDIPLDMENSTYTHPLTFNETFAMDVGHYDGYLQFNGKNGLQDVFIKDGMLDTPFDDDVVPDVDIELWNLINMRTKFDELTTMVPGFDDVLIPITIQVLDPMIMINNVEQDEDTLWLSGTTSLSDGTEIILTLDPDNYKLPSDILLHTWTTTAHGDLDSPRTFSTAMKIKPDELYIGVHEIKMTTTRNKFTTDTYYNFRISDVYVMPTPTPQITRKVVGMNWEPIAKPSTAATPEPIAIVDDVPVYETAIPTPTPTPEPTANPYALATTKPVSTLNKTNETIPTIGLPLWIGLLSVGFVFYFRRFR